MKSIPEALKQRQVNQKNETINKVQSTINALEVEGYPISIKSIMERTGLSRSVFAKQHIKDLINRTRIRLNSIHRDDTDITFKSDKITALESEMLKLTLKNEKLKKESEEKNILLLKLRYELAEKKDECEILRGKLHVLMQKCRIKGFIIEE